MRETSQTSFASATRTKKLVADSPSVPIAIAKPAQASSSTGTAIRPNLSPNWLSSRPERNTLASSSRILVTPKKRPMNCAISLGPWKRPRTCDRKLKSTM